MGVLQIQPELELALPLAQQAVRDRDPALGRLSAKRRKSACRRICQMGRRHQAYCQLNAVVANSSVARRGVRAVLLMTVGTLGG